MSIEDTAENAVEGSKRFLGKKIGPLPVWAWIAGLGGGLIVAVYVRRNAGSSGDEPATESASGWDQPDPGGTNGGIGGSAGGGGGGGTGGPDPWDDTPPAATPADTTPEAPWADTPAAPWAEPTFDSGPNPTARKPGAVATARGARTNREWREAAADAMARRGYRRGHVEDVLSKYLHKKRLTPAEADLVRDTFAVATAPPRPPRIMQTVNGRTGGHGKTQTPPRKDNGAGAGAPRPTEGPRPAQPQPKHNPKPDPKPDRQPEHRPKPQQQKPQQQKPKDRDDDKPKGDKPKRGKQR